MNLIAMILPNFYNHLLKIVIFYLTAFFTLTILSHSSSSITHETPHQRELTHSQTQSYSHVSIKLNTFFLILISFTLLRQIYANELCNNILVVALPYYVSFSDDVASQATKR